MEVVDSQGKTFLKIVIIDRKLGGAALLWLGQPAWLQS